jgi:pyridinium-3,5-biscarboxylic acid mononucleotide sulfurtransferase
MACLSSRIPYGESVTPEKLRMIEQAEDLLRDLGFYDVRVRHHELHSAERGVRGLFPASGAANSALRTPHSAMHLARIEVGPEEMPKLLQGGRARQVAEALKKIGYAHVTLDLQGYRRGSANEPPPVPGFLK